MTASLTVKPTTMQLVEKHIIDRADPRWAAIDEAAWMSKNIYNAANYRLRQTYIFTGRRLSYQTIEQQFKQRHLLPDQQLPLKVVQQVLKQVDHDWETYFAALKAWQANPAPFTGRAYLGTKIRPKAVICWSTPIRRSANERWQKATSNHRDCPFASRPRKNTSIRFALSRAVTIMWWKSSIPHPLSP